MSMSCPQKCLLSMIKFLFIAILTLPSTLSSLCGNFPDCQSLLQFKYGIKGDPEGHLQGWNETTFFCNWTGIRCHPYLKNKVIALELVNMGLQGSISPFIGNLSLLTTLHLQDNSLYGKIPASTGELSELAYLNMSSNYLQDSIPTALKRCRNLKILDLTYNNLSGSIPTEIGQMKNLTYLALSVNRLAGVIPQSLSNLTELIDLELAVNYFTGKIPPELGSLTKLEIMYFHTNYLEGTIPASLSNCTALREITLSENLLTGEIPLELGAKLHNLEKLYFLQNQLSGQIPVTLSNLSQLTLLDLSVNNLTGKVPSELGKLNKLEILYLHSNYLVSGFDNSSLRFLTAITNCSLLQKLHLGSNFFAGNLPVSVGDLSKNLYYFNLLDNRITGEIPKEIGNLSSLVRLTLLFNNLSGTIPATIGQLGQLQTLDLGINRLQGEIPDDMGRMANLGLLSLQNNLISGSIPSSLGNLSQLRYLYLSRNHLSGIIPTKLTHCSLLMLLDLSFNKLQGSLPEEMGLFSNLALSLNLSNNHLQGDIPASIGNLASVQAIDMSENQFSGKIPSTIGSCLSLEYLNLSNNMLEGSIPESLRQIKYLKVLDLTFNNLTGEIPIWLGGDLKVIHLNLSYNRLTGEVPRTGSFKNYGRKSFIGNAGLCGGTALMGLPPCEAQVKNNKGKTGKRVYLVLAIGISCALFLCVLVAVFAHRHFSGKRDIKSVRQFLMHLPSIKHETLTLTQRELEIATDGFHESNLLGRGSFGSVYKANINRGKILVAVKVLNQECTQGYKRFKRECQILSRIKHRNLVRILGATWNSDFRAILLQFLDNGNLEQHLYPNGSEGGGGCKLTMEERMGIAINIAHGLEYLHEGCSVKIVHCDLKPQNVLLDKDMVAYIADFGIAKLISADKHNGDVTTTTNLLRGSVGYIPPEYGQSIEVSEKGDVYSFGVMMLEMMTRKKPISDMFSDGLDMRKWVNSAFPNHVLAIVDTSLMKADMGGGCVATNMLELYTHMLDIGLMCTEDNPQRRPTMSMVARNLEKVWREMEVKIEKDENKE